MGRDVADTAALFSTLTGQQDNWQQDGIRDAPSGLTIAGWAVPGALVNEPGLVTDCEQFLHRLMLLAVASLSVNRLLIHNAVDMLGQVATTCTVMTGDL